MAKPGEEPPDKFFENDIVRTAISDYPAVVKLLSQCPSLPSSNAMATAATANRAGNFCGHLALSAKPGFAPVSATGRLRRVLSTGPGKGRLAVLPPPSVVDGNGNISEYLTTADDLAAQFENRRRLVGGLDRSAATCPVGVRLRGAEPNQYDPFGTLTRRTGSDSTRFQFRFSTKPRDPATGLYHYGYRWYAPLTGRWPSRDPIEEEGGLNLYGFVGNDGVGKRDVLGHLYGWDDVIVNADLVAEDQLRRAKERERDREENLRKIAEFHKVPGYLKDKCGNCSPATIQQGEDKLKSLFESFGTEKDDDVAERGAEKSGRLWPGKTTSCHDVNLSLLRTSLQGNIPECWACRFVHFHRFSIRRGSDHWWVECAAYDDHGNTVKVSAFDWWRAGAQPGEDPSINRGIYPYFDEQGSKEIPEKVWDYEVDP